jgi:hypothetical protein
MTAFPEDGGVCLALAAILRAKLTGSGSFLPAPASEG